MKKQLFIAYAIMLATTLNAQENRTSTDFEDGHSLEDKIQNPIANIASLSLDYNVSINNNNYNLLNIQPIIPVKLSKNWLLITHTIVPFLNTPTQTGYKNGVGNITLQGTLTLAKEAGFSWGAGPVFMLPTNIEGLGYEKFSIGPSLVALKQSYGLTYGLVLQNFFSVAGPSNVQDVNYLYTQVILSKNLNNGWYLYSNPNITADWNASSGNQWTIPLGAGAGKLIKHNRYLPINVNAGVYKYLAHPTDADWLIQAQVTFIMKYK